jgi:glucokinase
MSSSFPLLGIDIGGTKIALCVADSAGTILAKERMEGATLRPYPEVLPELLHACRRLVAGAGLRLDQVRACGISSPGPIDWAGGVIQKSPNMAWEDVPIRDDLARDLGVPVHFDNDANAGMLAEWFFGAAQGARNAIYLTMSTGVGGGVIAEGQLLHGVNGNAGELGHVILDLNGPPCGCGMRGCLEAYCGGRSVALRLQRLLRDRPDHAIMKLPEVHGDLRALGYPALRTAVREGIPLAVELWEEICLRLAQGLGLYLMAYNPEVVVFGTVAVYSGELLLDPVRRHLPRFAWKQMRSPCELRITALGAQIGELAGPAVALDNLRLQGAWSPAGPR